MDRHPYDEVAYTSKYGRKCSICQAEYQATPEYRERRSARRRAAYAAAKTGS